MSPDFDSSPSPDELPVSLQSAFERAVKKVGGVILQPGYLVPEGNKLYLYSVNDLQLGIVAVETPDGILDFVASDPGLDLDIRTTSYTQIEPVDGRVPEQEEPRILSIRLAADHSDPHASEGLGSVTDQGVVERYSPLDSVTFKFGLPAAPEKATLDWPLVVASGTVPVDTATLIGEFRYSLLPQGPGRIVGRDDVEPFLQFLVRGAGIELDLTGVSGELLGVNESTALSAILCAELNKVRAKQPSPELSSQVTLMSGLEQPRKSSSSLILSFNVDQCISVDTQAERPSFKFRPVGVMDDGMRPPSTFLGYLLETTRALDCKLDGRCVVARGLSPERFRSVFALGIGAAYGFYARGAIGNALLVS